MKLDAFDLFGTMAKPHYEPIGRFGGNFEAIRQAFALDYQRMIAACRKVIRDVRKDRFPIMNYCGRFPVHGHARPNDASAEVLSYRLMAETYPEYWHLACKPRDNCYRDPCGVRRSRPRRDQDPLRTDLAFDLTEGDLIVMNDAHFNSKLTKILDEIVGERIVIIDDQQHLISLYAKLGPARRSLFTIVCNHLMINTLSREVEPMSKKLLVLILLLFAVMSAAQTPSADKAAEREAKLKKEALEFLRETSVEVGRLRTAENRISFNSELASLMWFQDDKEARAMYGMVISDFKQLLAQFDAAMNSQAAPNDDDGDVGGAIFGVAGKTKIERKFRIAMAVRQQIAMSLAEHAPDLAYNFYYDSLNLISSPQFRKETERSDKYFEGRLLQRIAESDAAKASEYGRESMKRGIEINHLELLKKIYAKDAEKGIAFGDALLSRVKSERSSIKSAYFYSNFLSFAASNLEASKKPGGKKAIYTQNDIRDIADQFAQFFLDSDPEKDDMSALAFVDKIEKYAPGRGAQIRAKYKNSGGPSTAISTASNAAIRGSTGSGAGSSGRANANVSDDADRTAREAREKAEKEMMDGIKDLSSKPLPKEERDKVIAEARKIIARTPGREKKIGALSMLAAQVAKAGDRELADQIMLDAERIVNPQPKNYMDFMLTWMLAAGYAEANPDKAFPILESTISRANESISAFVKVAEFIDVQEEMVVDGEVQVGMFGGEMIRSLTGELGVATTTLKSLATADFTKTRNLANTFDRTEIRVLARMMVLRAVLGGDKKGVDRDEPVDVDGEIDMNTDIAPPPPSAPKPRPNDNFR